LTINQNVETKQLKTVVAKGNLLSETRKHFLLSCDDGLNHNIFYFFPNWLWVNTLLLHGFFKIA